MASKGKGGEALKIKDTPQIDTKSTDEVKEKVKEVKQGAKDAAKLPIGPATEVLSGIKNVAMAALPSAPPLPSVSLASAPEVKEIEPEKPKTIDKPAIIFISGFGMANLSSREGGLEEMAKHVPDAEQFDWDQKEEVMDIIKNTSPFRPVILIGHSLGGDTAVEIANELNTIEHGYRRVDLLVTLDSVGLNNDIIPNNVEKNLNFIGGSDLIFNDGPNIARDTKFTEVLNELVPSDHRGMDENNNVQQKIFIGISKVLGDPEGFKKMADKAYEDFKAVGQRLVDVLKRDQ